MMQKNISARHETASDSKEGPMNEKVLKRLRRGFEETYIDPYDTARNIVHDLRNNLISYTRRPNAYIAPYTSLVTSSMMGKSRLMKEMARHVPTVYICLREQGVSGYPQPSPVVVEWISSPLPGTMSIDKNDEENILPTFKFCVFLLVLLGHLASLVKDHYATSSQQSDSGSHDFSWMWEFCAEPNEESNPGLEKFWGEVIEHRRFSAVRGKEKSERGKVERKE
jgi:hypothetical protein